MLESMSVAFDDKITSVLILKEGIYFVGTESGNIHKFNSQGVKTHIGSCEQPIMRLYSLTLNNLLVISVTNLCTLLCKY